MTTSVILGFYITAAVLNLTLMVMLREAFTENGKSHRIWLVATLVLTLLSFSVWIVGAVVIGYDIASRIIRGKNVDYGDGDKHGAE